LAQPLFGKINEGLFFIQNSKGNSTIIKDGLAYGHYKGNVVKNEIKISKHPNSCNFLIKIKLFF